MDYVSVPSTGTRRVILYCTVMHGGRTLAILYCGGYVWYTDRLALYQARPLDPARPTVAQIQLDREETKSGEFS
jgi:hypothetical protein